MVLEIHPEVSLLSASGHQGVSPAPAPTTAMPPAPTAAAPVQAPTTPPAPVNPAVPSPRSCKAC